MNTATLDPQTDAAGSSDDPLAFSGWLLEVLPEIDTTNRVAAKLPAWHAVRADTQTAGRGRTGRVWTSDVGGLWLSAVVPCPGPRERWALLPLATAPLAGYEGRRAALLPGLVQSEGRVAFGAPVANGDEAVIGPATR